MPTWLLRKGGAATTGATTTGAAKPALVRAIEAEPGTVAHTTGPLVVPSQPNTTLYLYVTSRARQPVVVEFAVDRLRDGGAPEPIVRRGLTVAPGEAASAQLPAPAGDTIAVQVTVPESVRSLVLPSLTVTQFFPADGATTPLVTVGPKGFVPPTQSTLATGLFDVSQGVAAARPFLAIHLLNLAAREQRVTVTIDELNRDQDERKRLLEQTFTIPAGHSAGLLTDQAEGRTVEVTLSGAQAGLMPSATVGQRFLYDGSSTVLVRYGPPDFATLA